MRNKKSSLTLSINAIVVLILAITLLGLGLGFIKKQFGSATSQFKDVDQQTQSDMIKELETSGDMVTMNMKEFEVESGKPMTAYMAIRNTGAEKVEYVIQFICDQSLAHDSCRSDSTDQSIIKWNLYDSTTNQMNWFSTFKIFTISPGRGKAIPIKVQASGDTETYKGRIIVWKCDRVNPPGTTPCTTTNSLNFDKKGAVPPTGINGADGGTLTELATVRYTLKVI